MTNIQERIAVQTEDSLAEISKFETKDGVTFTPHAPNKHSKSSSTLF